MRGLRTSLGRLVAVGILAFVFVAGPIGGSGYSTMGDCPTTGIGSGNAC